MNNQAYFSNIRFEILSILKKAEKEILIAMAWFTSKELLSAIIQCLKRGVKVKIVLLDDIINHCDFGADFNQFIAEKGSELYLYPPSPQFMHHKFCVIDGETLITGSYNWTNYAESRNLENIVVTSDSSLIEEYITCFNDMKKNLIQSNTFEIVSQAQIPNREFVSRLADFAQEVYAMQNSELQPYRKHFEEKVDATKIVLPDSVKSYIDNISSNPPLQDAKGNVVITTVENFRFAVSRYNIGFKANLIDQGGKEGLKVMIEKGQALPYTITSDAKSANAGDYDSMSSSCEFYYGDTTNLSKCTKFGETLTLKNLPKRKEGEVKFKIIISLDETGKLSIKFVCTDTGNGVEGKHTNIDFIEYRHS